MIKKLFLAFILAVASVASYGNSGWTEIKGGKSSSAAYQIKCGAGTGWQRCGEDESPCKLDAKNHVMLTEHNCASDGGAIVNYYAMVDGVRSLIVRPPGVSKQNAAMFPSCAQFDRRISAGNATLHGRTFKAEHDFSGPTYYVELHNKVAYGSYGSGGIFRRLNVGIQKNNYNYLPTTRSGSVTSDPSDIIIVPSALKGASRLHPLCKVQ